MTNTTGERRVQVMVAGDRPHVFDAALIRHDGGTVTLRAPELVPVGARIIVIEGRTKILGRCTAAADGVITATAQWERATDDRSSPRVDVPCRVRFAFGGGDWAEALSPVNVALSGVRFTTSSPAPAVGDRVALWLVFEGADAEWQATALARRVDAGPPSSVAVEFIDVPDAALEFLSEHTHKE